MAGHGLGWYGLLYVLAFLSVTWPLWFVFAALCWLLCVKFFCVVSFRIIFYMHKGTDLLMYKVFYASYSAS
jgi:hypothetical protein